MKKIILALFLLGIVGAGLAYWKRSQVKDYLRYARDRAYGTTQAQAKGCAQTPEPSRPSPVKASPLPALTTPKHFDQCASYAHVFDIPVTVSSDREQKPPLTKFMLPFSRESLVFSLNGFVVKDESGNILPAQFETLARYDAHPGDCESPVRYAYAHVLAAPEGKAVWRVVHEPQKSLTGTTLQIDGNTVSTQIARFSLGANGIQKAQMGDRVISEVKGDGGFMVEAPTLLALSKPWRMEWERRGPYVATFVIRGYYGQRQLGYSARLHFFAGSASVRVEHTYYHHALEGEGANDLANTTTVKRAWMRLPLASKTDAVRVGGCGFHKDATAVAQKKRGPNLLDPQCVLRNGSADLKTGGRAKNAFVQAGDVRAELLYFAERDPQALSYNATANAIDIGFTSEPITIGGARGIWSVAAVSFDKSSPQSLLKPLLGAVAPSYLNTTQTLGPYATTGGEKLFSVLKEIHDNTNAYLLQKKVTGQQLWPDLPASQDIGDEFYDGGDNNYWNWSKPGFDEFFRTGDNRYVYDFSLAEAITFAETIVVRPAHDKLYQSTLTGLAPCYGPSRGFGEVFREGLNQRVDNCPGDYTYNKTLAIAFLASADHRFSDYFAEAALGTIDVLGEPAEIGAGGYMELTIGRLGEQRLETVMNGAEFTRDAKISARLRTSLRQYVDLMLGESLIDGHMCDVSGLAVNSACAAGYCESPQAWMVPTPYQFLVRASRFLDHEKLKAWTIAYGLRAMQFHTSMRDKLPNMKDLDGWATVYACDTNAQGVIEASCKKLRDIEAEGRFYDNGLLAFFNVFGLILAVDPSDPHKICDWLPQHYYETLTKISLTELNELIWGKSSGQALAYAPEAAGALSACKP